jgi:HD domain
MIKLFDEHIDEPLQESIDLCREESEEREKPATVRHELWLLLSLFVIAFILNSLVDSNRMVLGFYTLPTLFSAYKYGRRHAVLTSFASVFIVVLVTHFNPTLFTHRMFPAAGEKWFDLTVWGGILVITGYFMGTLCDRKDSHLRELRESYHGILTILQHIAANDKHSQNHPYRVATCATKIAEKMELDAPRIEDIRAAALLHDIDKLGISREILYKSVNLTEQELNEFRDLMAKGKIAAPPIGGSLRRVIPIVLAFQSALDDKGQVASVDTLPLEARIIAVADTYETLTSDPACRVAPREAMESIQRRAGGDFDEAIVDALVSAYHSGRALPTYA